MVSVSEVAEQASIKAEAIVIPERSASILPVSFPGERLSKKKRVIPHKTKNAVRISRFDVFLC